MNKIFIDTSFIIALYNLDDTFHTKAVSVLSNLTDSQYLITHAILLEIGNSFAKVEYRKIGIQILNMLESDPNITIIAHGDKINQRAINLYKSRLDKEWGLTDCVSFVVMESYKITMALTTDKHFEQAGFRALLL